MLAAGTVEADEGTVDAPIGRSTRQRTRMAVTARGRQARTEYRVVTRYLEPVPTTLLEARLDTGRTHQVRVHLAAIGHPVIGDERYGRSLARPRPIVAEMASGRLFLQPYGSRSTTRRRQGDVGTSPVPDDLAGCSPASRPEPGWSGGLVGRFDLGQGRRAAERARLGLAGPAHADAQP